ncbi:DUF3137 domain-containing protein [Mycoplasmatota bacterium]|nr:DUF3137 domain-containing protein [Mycoplasmatota bacterium]
MIDEKILKKLNLLRKKVLAQYIIYYISIPIITSFLFLFSTYISHTFPFLTIIILYLLIINLVFYSYVKPKFINKYHIEYKKEILAKVSTYLHETILSLSIGISEEELLKTNILPFITQYYSSHLIRGSIDHIPFKSSNVEFFYYHHKDQTLSFKGQWYVFKFNKPFKGITHIYEKNESIYQINKPINLNLYQTEDINFNRRFHVYSNNIEQTNQLLRFHLRERINLLERKYHGKLMFIFNQDYLHIGINNNTSRFTPSLFHKINEIDFMNQIEDFLLIKNIIKYIKTLDKLSNTYLTYIQKAIVS